MSHHFTGEIEGYSVNTFIRDGWKIADTHDRDDFLQEAWMVFDKCSRMYPDVEPKHFMALYKTALDRRVLNLALAQTRRRARETPKHHQTKCHLDAPQNVANSQPIGELENAGYLKRLVTQAPYEVRLVLNLFLSAPTELVGAAMLAWQHHGHPKAGGNEHVRQLLGLPEGSKPLDMVEDYFTK